MPPRTSSRRATQPAADGAGPSNAGAGPSNAAPPAPVPTQQQPAAAGGPVADSYRLTFVQYLMANGCVKESDAKALVKKMAGSDASYKDIVGTANTGIEVAGLAIKTIKSLVDQQIYVGLVNTMADVHCKPGTTYTPSQLNFYKHVIDAIARQSEDEAPAGVPSLSETYLLNVEMYAAPAGQAEQAAGTQAVLTKPLGMQEKVTALRQLSRDGWLAAMPNRANFYTLGVRTLLELGRDYLMKLEGLPEATLTAWDINL